MGGNFFGGIFLGYVCEGYYRGEFRGSYVGEDLGELIERASALIDGLTHNRILGIGFEGLTKFQQKAVRRACCMIVDHMAAADRVPGSDVESFWMQDVRINMRKRRLKPWEAAGCGMWAWLTLMQTGLMRGAFR